MNVSPSGIVDWLRSSLWVPPVAGVAVTAAFGAVMTAGPAEDGGWRNSFGYRGSVETATDLLIGELGTLVTTLTVAFSMVLVALQMASSQFSPRVVRRWTRDPITKITLTIYLSSIAYILMVLQGLSGEEGPAPSIAITVSMLFVLASALSSLVYFHHLAQTMRIERALHDVQRSGQRAVATAGGTKRQGAVGPDAHPGVNAVQVHALRDGYVRGLVDRRNGSGDGPSTHVQAAVSRQLGDWVAKGEAIGTAWNSDGSQATAEAADLAVDSMLDLSVDRSIDDEIELTIRILVDFAIKAISPGINDPYTAVQAVHRLKSLMIQVQEVGTTRVEVANEGMTISLRPTHFEDRLRLACSQITMFAAGSPSVLLAIVNLLDAVQQAAGGVSGPVARQLDYVREVAAALPFRSDTEEVLAAVQRVESGSDHTRHR